MAKFDRYLLSQLMAVFGFFALVLVMVLWVNQAVKLFDQLIANGNSALVFLEFSALTLPNVVGRALPIAAFGAAIYTANRLAGDSELVVVQSTGFSPYRLARPVLAFGIVVALLLSILTNVLIPASRTQLAKRQVEISSNSTARFLQEGQFLHPADGITFYIREISPDSLMAGMFLADSRDPDQRISYSATQAMLVASDTGPKLIMLDGMMQILRLSDQRLATTQFAEFVFGIGPLLARRGGQSYGHQQMSTRALLNPQPADLSATGMSRSALQLVGHTRISLSFLTIAVALIGFATLMVGGYSRFGLWRQIAFAVVLFILLKTADNILSDVASRGDGNWPVIYVSSLIGFAISGAMLWLSARPAIFTRRIRQAGT